MKEKRIKTKRLLALDVARGLAVIGMYIQHFALNERNSFVSGNTMILFMLCSGISYTLMGRKLLAGEETAEEFRTRVLARSVFIDLAGYVLILLNGPFAVVLPAYAMLFSLALILIRRPAGTLAAVSAALYAAAPPLMIVGLSLFADAALLSDIAGGPLSALAWMPVFVAGMAIGRLNLKDSGVAKRMIALGAAVLIPVKLFTVFALPTLRAAVENRMMQAPMAEADPWAVWPRNAQQVQWHLIFMDMPQGGSMFELLIGTGGSLILLGVLLLAEKKLAAWYRPFACAGRSALTLYALQFLIAWGAALAGVEVTGLEIGSFLFGDVLVAAAAVAAGCLLAKLPNAPMEAALRKFEGCFLGPR